MSENLSIDEIIKKAEQIKAEAERQLKQAEQSLDKQAKTAIDEIAVDETKVIEKLAQIIEKDEDIKEYTPAKKSNAKSFNSAKEIDCDDEEMKIAPGLNQNTKTRAIGDIEGGKTKPVELDADDDVKEFKPSKNHKNEERTRRIFMSKSKKAEDSDLEIVPTIVAKEQIFDDSTTDEEIGIQMTFEGFDDAMDTVPTIDESLAEQILEERRREKVGKFRLFGPDETDTELGNNVELEEEFEDKSETTSFIEGLFKKKSSIQAKLWSSTAITAILLIITVFRDSRYFPVGLSSHTAYYVTAIVLFLAVVLININVIVHGFNFKNSINSDFPIATTAILVMAHTFAMLFNSRLALSNGVLLPCVCCFALIMSQLGKRQMMIRIIDNFEFLTDGADKYTIENVVNTVDAEIIGRGLVEGEPLIKTSVKTDFPTNFLEISCKNEPGNKVSRIVFLVSLALSSALMIAITIMDNLFTGINVAICALTASMPVSALFLTNLMLTEVSAHLSQYGSRVNGNEGAIMADDANIMIMEAGDLFGNHSCDLHGVKTFNGAKIDDAIIYAAAVMIQTKSPVANIFDDVIIGKQSILPRVDGVIYEDRMGTSAWIYEKKILVGNRDLLLRHGVSVPKESFEEKYTIKGRHALYLAVDGQMMAMFIVSYSAEPRIKKELKRLEKSGILIAVKSCDPYINDDSIAEIFNLPKGFISVMNYSAARVYDKYSGMVVEKSPAYVIHDGSALGFVSAMHGAEIIVSTKHLLNFLLSFGAAIGFIVIALLAVIGTYAQISAFGIIAFQTIWTVFMMIVAKLRGLSL